jgi:hypothetical protein
MTERSKTHCVWVALTLASLLACSSSGNQPNPTPVRIEFAGVGQLGIFDPSLERDPGGRLWMSYSAVDPSSIAGNKLISTRIAHSDDGGTTWVDDGVVNAASDTPLPSPANQGT